MLNSITIVVLLRERSEIEGLRAQGFLAGRAEQGPAAGAIGSPGEAVPLAARRSVNIVLAEVNQESGLTQAYDAGDGLTRPATIEGIPCRELARPGGTLAKIYFIVDPSFKKATRMHAWVEVEYFDGAPDGLLYVEYDGPKAYAGSEWGRGLKHSSQWNTVTFELADPSFSGRENGGADFRIVATKSKVFVRRVTLKAN